MSACSAATDLKMRTLPFVIGLSQSETKARSRALKMGLDGWTVGPKSNLRHMMQTISIVSVMDPSID